MGCDGVFWILLPLHRKHSCSSAAPGWLRPAARRGTVCRTRLSRPQVWLPRNPHPPGFGWDSTRPWRTDEARTDDSDCSEPFRRARRAATLSLHVPESRKQPLLHQRISFFLISSAASAYRPTGHCFQRLLIILLPGGKISHCLRPHNASSGI